MGWDVTIAGDKLNLSLAASQLMENPSEIFKKIKKLIVNNNEVFVLEFSFADVEIWFIKKKGGLMSQLVKKKKKVDFV